MAEKKKQCTVIVSCDMAHDDAERFLDSWENANDVLRRPPGFVSTALHRQCRPTPKTALCARELGERRHLPLGPAEPGPLQRIRAAVALSDHTSGCEIVRT